MGVPAMDADGNHGNARFDQAARLEERSPWRGGLVVADDAVLPYHLEWTLAVACANLVRFLGEVEGVPDLGGRHHLQGTGLKRIDAGDGSLAVKVPAEGVKGVEQVLPTCQPLG